MKRKHWQGYGTVNARVIKREATYGSMKLGGFGVTDRKVEIEVSGNHECGLELPFRDKYRLGEWLGSVGGFKTEEIQDYDCEPDYSKPVDTVVYKIWLKDKSL